MTKINLPFFKPEVMNHLMIVVNYIDVTGKEKQGLFVIDSGCTDSYIASNALDMAKIKVTQNQIEDYQNGWVTHWVKTCQIELSMGSERILEEFFVSDSSIFDDDVIGILGNRFLQRNGLSIDYGTLSLRTSDIDHSNLCIGDCAYFFPMEPGLRAFGVPVLMLRGRNGQDYVALADTGSDANVITEEKLHDATQHYRRTKEGNCVQMLDSQLQTTKAAAKVLLGSLQGGEEYLRFDLHAIEFLVIDRDVILTSANDGGADGESERERVDAIIGNSFLRSQGLILDFNAKIIYKRKV